MKMTASSASIVLLLTLPAALFAQTPVTAHNWKTHPEIVAVRSIFESTEASIARKELTKSFVRDSICTDASDGELDRVLYVDAKSRVLRYTNGEGTGDHFVSMNWYYDTLGTLRFVFVQGNAINGTKIENRVYFDATGKRLWQDYRAIKGHDHTLGRDLPSNRLIRDPKKEFARKPARCDTTGTR
jgi:hypothetical protein